MGGAGNDSITIGGGTNLVFGDGGFFDWLFGGDTDANNLDLAQSAPDPMDGDDTISIGTGNNLVIGGGGRDTITVADGTGFNVIVGDSGRITRAAIDTHPFGGLPLTLGRVETLVDGIGDADKITTGDGSNVIFGGAGGDTILAGIHVAPDGTITPGTGTNLVFGDGG